MTDSEKEIELDGIRMTVEDAKTRRRVYQHLKDQGESEAADLVRSLSIEVGQLRAEVHKASREVLELYRANTLIAKALAHKSLEVSDHSKGMLDLLKELRSAEVEVHPVSQSEYDEIRKRRADAEPAAAAAPA